MTESRTASFTWPSRRTVLISLGAVAAAGLLAVLGLLAYLFLYVAPKLPALDTITDYKPKIPLRIYTADQVLIGEFGEEHRDFVPIRQMPELMKKAVLAIEDTRFYEHNGIDWVRMGGAVRSNLLHGFGQGGASTITMQVARNFYLTRAKVASRKVTEIMLAMKIEEALDKDQILELYMNQIYLGQRSFGFGAAAETYFGKPVGQLSVAETAMLAGLPQNPSRHNPAANPKRAKVRQMQVLGRMRDLAYITEAQYQQAAKEPMHINHKGQEFDTHAEYVAELARQAVYAQFKEDSYTKGISVITTILKADQDAAYESVRRNVLAYDQRHGYRGPEAFITLPDDEQERDTAIDEALQKRPTSDGLIAAMVLEASPKLVKVETSDGDIIEIDGTGLRFAAAALNGKGKPAIQLRPGAVVRIAQDARKKDWAISQVPQVAAAFVSLDANTGAYHALVGGFDFGLQKFNHVTQAWRQPGSAIKPFVYSASLEKGFSPATMINDVPLEMSAAETGSKAWNPQNDDGVFDGPISMRFALAHSKNVPSIRLLRAIGVPYAHDYLGRFGFDLARHPQNLTMALGTGAVTPLQMAGAYALFANGGFQVQPYLIASIKDGDGKIISETKPPAVAQESARVIDSRNAFVVDSMLREVTRSGTGAASTKQLARSDIAGKTGTTNDSFDGWFAGYGGGVVAVAWMGYDEPRSLGGREFGATLGLPIWIDYMRTALAKVPQAERQVPQGLQQVDGDWMYDEFTQLGAVRELDMDQLPENAEGDVPLSPGQAPTTLPIEAVPIVPPVPPPAFPAR